ncbi:hypothetical protein SS7213T_02783, partial [Staphylococcus simiae CCM 7213 = CCUG 51256]
ITVKYRNLKKTLNQQQKKKLMKKTNKGISHGKTLHKIK